MLKLISEKEYLEGIKTATPSLDFNSIYKHSVTYVAKSEVEGFYNIYLKGIHNSAHYVLSLSEQYIKLIAEHSGNMGFELLEHFLDREGNLVNHKSETEVSQFIEMTMANGVCPVFDETGKLNPLGDKRKVLVTLSDKTLFGLSESYCIFLSAENGLVTFDQNDLNISLATILETFGFQDEHLQQVTALYMEYEYTMDKIIELENTAVYYSEFELTIINKKIMIGLLIENTVHLPKEYLHQKKVDLEKSVMSYAPDYSIIKYTIDMDEKDYPRGRMFIHIHSTKTGERLFSVQYHVAFTRGKNSRTAGMLNVLGIEQRSIVQGIPQTA